MDAIPEQLQALVDQARVDSALPMTNATRTAKMLLNHGRFVREVPSLLAWTRGYQDACSTLIVKVDELLYLCFDDPHNTLGWSTEVPRGRAPSVRQVLEQIKRIREGMT